MRRSSTILWIFLTILLSLGGFGCSESASETVAPAPEPTPDCEYKLPQITPYSSAPSPISRFGISFDQKKFREIMSLEIKDNFCYIEHQGKVAFYKVQDLGSLDSSGLFDHLPSPPEEIQTYWDNFIKLDEERQGGNKKTNLLGLTLTSFYDNAKEKRITHTEILLNTRATLWALRHEFIHMLIAQKRIATKTESISYIPYNEIETQKEEFYDLVVSDAPENKIVAAFLKLKKNMMALDRHEFLEEISIEFTLHHYALQENLKIAEDTWLTEVELGKSFNLIYQSLRERENFYADLFKKIKYINVTRELPEFEKLKTEFAIQIRDEQAEIRRLSKLYREAWGYGD
jgi:hypothetical protein